MENNSFYFFDIPESLRNFIKPFCHEQWTQYVTHQIRQNVQRYRFTSFSGVGLFKWFAAIVWNHWSIYAHSVNVNDAFVKTTTRKKLSWFIQKQIKTPHWILTFFQQKCTKSFGMDFFLLEIGVKTYRKTLSDFFKLKSLNDFFGWDRIFLFEGNQLWNPRDYLVSK